MWYLCRVYVGAWSTDKWFARVPIVGDLVDVGRGEMKVELVQLRTWDVPPGENEIVALVHAG